MKKNLTVFRKTNANKLLNFYWNEIKVLHVTQKNFSGNKEKNRKIGKKLPKSDQHMYNFIKQNYIEAERVVVYMNYQREAAILTDFWQKDGWKILRLRK